MIDADRTVEGSSTDWIPQLGIAAMLARSRRPLIYLEVLFSKVCRMQSNACSTMRPLEAPALRASKSR